MIFNDHSRLEGMHAFLSPSSGSWVNYNEEKLIERYRTKMAAAHGTRLHEFAKECILLGQKLPRSEKTLNRYVNDAIGFRMIPEQMLFYSINCFGTADTIKFEQNKGLLRIHDLKNGVTKVTMRQLEIYTAIFCLEYDIRPSDIEIVLRIYQNDSVWEHNPELPDIVFLIDRIQTCDKIIEMQKAEASL